MGKEMQDWVCRLGAGVLVLAAVSVRAEVTPYWRIATGVSYMEHADVSMDGGDGGELMVDPGLSVEGAVGLDFLGYVPGRLELAAFSEYHDVDGIKSSSGRETFDGSVVLGTLMVNFYMDLVNFNETHAINHEMFPCYPYLFIGAGMGVCRWEFEGEDDTDLVPVGNAGAGMTFMLSERTFLDLQYKYLHGKRSKDNSGFRKIETRSQSVQLGVRVLY